MQWAATGVLKTAWSKDYEQLHREAEDGALEAERALREAGKESEADALRDAMARAHVRDLFVRLQWSGDGDLDLSVEEPLGTTASCQEPQRAAAGSIGTTATVPIRKTAMKSMSAPTGCPASTSYGFGGSTGRSSGTGHS